MEERQIIHCTNCSKILCIAGGLTENLELLCPHCRKTYNVSVFHDGKVQLFLVRKKAKLVKR